MSNFFDPSGLFGFKTCPKHRVDRQLFSGYPLARWKFVVSLDELLIPFSKPTCARAHALFHPCSFSKSVIPLTLKFFPLNRVGARIQDVTVWRRRRLVGNQLECFETRWFGQGHQLSVNFGELVQGLGLDTTGVCECFRWIDPKDEEAAIFTGGNEELFVKRELNRRDGAVAFVRGNENRALR